MVDGVKSTSEGQKSLANDVSAEALMRFVLGTVLVSGLILAGSALIGWGSKSGLGALIGAMLATANLWALQKIGRGFLGEAKQRRMLWGMAGLLKFLAIGAVLWFLISQHFVGGVSLIVGYAALPIGITFGSLVGLRLAEGS